MPCQLLVPKGLAWIEAYQEIPAMLTFKRISLRKHRSEMRWTQFYRDLGDTPPRTAWTS